MYFRKKSKVHKNELKQNTCNKKVSIPLYGKKKYSPIHASRNKSIDPHYIRRGTLTPPESDV